MGVGLDWIGQIGQRDQIRITQIRLDQINRQIDRYNVYFEFESLDGSPKKAGQIDLIYIHRFRQIDIQIDRIRSDQIRLEYDQVRLDQVSQIDF